MSKLKTLISQLCPYGVEYKRLEEVASYMDGAAHEKILGDQGKYIVTKVRFISSDGQFKKYCDVRLSPVEKDDVIMVMSDLPNGKSLAKCFLIDKNNTYTINQRVCSLTANPQKLLPRFLYYILNRNEQLLKYDNGCSQTHLKKKWILDVKVPVPPIAVQSEIVRILDNFVELTAVLTAELTARKAQYAYYQDKLLTQSAGTIHSIGECCVSIADGDHQPPPKADSGVPFITISNFTENGIDFTDTKFAPHEYYDKLDQKRRAQKDDILYSVVGSFGIPVHITEDKPFVFQRHIAILRPNAEIIAPRYLYHVMKSDAFYKKADAAAIGAAQRTISLSALNRMKISVPSLEVQERLVRVLDNFDAICTDLNIGLPAEIEARKKQYEFYRDQLLTFAETGKTILTDRQTDRQTDRRA